MSPKSISSASSFSLTSFHLYVDMVLIGYSATILSTAFKRYKNIQPQDCFPAYFKYMPKKLHFLWSYRLETLEMYLSSRLYFFTKFYYFPSVKCHRFDYSAIFPKCYIDCSHFSQLLHFLLSGCVSAKLPSAE